MGPYWNLIKIAILQFDQNSYYGLFQTRALLGTISNDGLIRNYFESGPHWGLYQIRAVLGTISNKGFTRDNFGLGPY